MPLKHVSFAICNLVVVLVLAACGTQPKVTETVEINLTEFRYRVIQYHF